MRYLLAFMVVLVLGMPGAALAAADAVGVAVQVEGAVLVTRAGAADAARLESGDALYLHDEITTGADSRAQVAFADKTSVTLAGAAGSLRIDDYVYEPGEPAKNRARFTILRAGFLFVSGALGKTESPDVEIGMDFGTIGIRGTTIWRSMKDGECRIWLEDGQIEVFNDGGAVSLRPGEGTRMGDTEVAPVAAETWDAEDVAWIKGVVER